MKNGILSLLSQCLIGSTLLTPHRLPLFSVSFCGHSPQQCGCRDNGRRVSLAFLWWTPSWLSVLTVHTAMHKAKGWTYLCKHRQMYVSKAKTTTRHCVATVSPGNTPLHTDQKYVIQNNIEQLWEYHFGFGVRNLIKYRYLHSLRFAYSLGKILQAIPQSLLPKWGHGDHNG